MRRQSSCCSNMGRRHDIPNSRGALPIQAAAGQGSRSGDTRGYFNTSDVQQRSIAALDLLLKAGADIDAGASAGQSASARRRHLGLERRHPVPRRTRLESQCSERPGADGPGFAHRRPRRPNTRTERNRSAAGEARRKAGNASRCWRRCCWWSWRWTWRSGTTVSGAHPIPVRPTSLHQRDNPGDRLSVTQSI